MIEINKKLPLCLIKHILDFLVVQNEKFFIYLICDYRYVEYSCKAVQADYHNNIMRKLEEDRKLKETAKITTDNAIPSDSQKIDKISIGTGVYKPINNNQVSSFFNCSSLSCKFNAKFYANEKHLKMNVDINDHNVQSGNNIFYGYMSGQNIKKGFNNIFLGNGAGYKYEEANNKLIIGNALCNLIKGNFKKNTVKVRNLKCEQLECEQLECENLKNKRMDDIEAKLDIIMKLLNI